MMVGVVSSLPHLIQSHDMREQLDRVTMTFMILHMINTMTARVTMTPYHDSTSRIAWEAPNTGYDSKNYKAN